MFGECDAQLRMAQLFQLGKLEGRCVPGDHKLDVAELLAGGAFARDAQGSIDSLGADDRVAHVLGGDGLGEAGLAGLVGLVVAIAATGLHSKLTAIVCFSHIRYSIRILNNRPSQFGCLGEEVRGELHGCAHIALDLHLALHEQSVGL